MGATSVVVIPLTHTHTYIYIYKWIYMDIPGPCISMSTIGNCESFPEGRRFLSFPVGAACWIGQGLEEAYGKGHGRMADVGDG